MSAPAGTRALAIVCIGAAVPASVDHAALEVDAVGRPVVSSAGVGFDARAMLHIAPRVAQDDPLSQLLDGVREERATHVALDVAIESMERRVHARPDDEGRRRLATLTAARQRLHDQGGRWVDRFLASEDAADKYRILGDLHTRLAELSSLLALAYSPPGPPLAGPPAMLSLARMSQGAAEGGSPPTQGDAHAKQDPSTLARLEAPLPPGEGFGVREGRDRPTGGENPRLRPLTPGPSPGERGESAGRAGTGAAPTAVPPVTSGPSPSTAAPPALPETARSYFSAMKEAITSPAPPGGRAAAPAPDTATLNEPAGSEGGAGTDTRSWWRPILVALGVVAAVVLYVLAFRAAWKWLDSHREVLERRLRRVAAPLAGAAAAAEGAGAESIFRPRERGGRFSRVWRPIERRYPLVDPPKALAFAVLAGALGAGFVAFALWFLKAPAGWWTLPLVSCTGAFGAWVALGRQQARREAEFIRQFPEIVDQIVRLAGAGVPPVEAVAVVAEDAQAPVRPVLKDVCDALLAGLDADRALRMASERVRLAEFTLFAAALRLQRRAGGSISGAFANLSATLRERNKTALKTRATTAQTRLTLLVLAVMPVLVLIGQQVTAPESVEILFSTEDGTMLLRVGIGLIVTGLLVARAIAARGAR